MNHPGFGEKFEILVLTLFADRCSEGTQKKLGSISIKMKKLSTDLKKLIEGIVVEIDIYTLTYVHCDFSVICTYYFSPIYNSSSSNRNFVCVQNIPVKHISK